MSVYTHVFLVVFMLHGMNSSDVLCHNGTGVLAYYCAWWFTV